MTGSGRVALVTGASGGIGRACAVALARAGHRVACGYGGNAEAAEVTAKECGDGAITVAIDVTDAGAVDQAFTTVEEQLGSVEILVNNAGVTRDGLVMRMSDDDFATVIDTSLTGAFHTTRRATAKMMRARFGRIVNIGSVSGLSGGPGQANYSAAKAGLVGLTRAVARELASRGVTANVVAPGPVATAMTDALSGDRKAELTAAVPMARFGSPEEVAAAVAFLTSDEAGYITGAVLPVDGGMGMGH